MTDNLRENELKHGLMAAVITGVVAFFVYLLTMTPALHGGDSPEIATAAYTLGIAHPTGYPIYTMLVHLVMKLIPLEPVAVSTMFSAMCIALGAAVCSRIAYGIFTRTCPNMYSAVCAVSAAGAAWAFAFTPAAWNAALITEVYAFQWLLTVGFARAVQLALQKRFDNGSIAAGALGTAALLCGIGLAHHRMSLFMVVPLGLTVAVVVWKATLKQRILTMLLVLFCAQLPLWSYLYLPIRSAQQPAMNWGQPDRWDRFRDHVRGGDYVSQRFMVASPGHPFTAESYAQFAKLQTAQLIGDTLDQFPTKPMKRTATRPRAFDRGFSVPANNAGAVTAIIILALALTFCTRMILSRCNRDTQIFVILTGLLAAQNLALLYMYNIADISDYELTPLWFVWLAAITGTAATLRASHTRLQTFSRIIPIALLLFAGFQCASHYRLCNRSGDREMEEFSYMLLPNEEDVLPRESILLTAGDADIFQTWYRQQVRRERTDVLVFGSNFIHRPWYESYFTTEQKSKYQLKFFQSIPRGPENFAQMLCEGILDKNVGKYCIVTTIQDRAVLDILAQKFKLSPAGYCPALKIEPKDQ